MFSYFAGPLMNKLTGLFSASPGRRFLRFVLNLNLRPYLRNPIQQGELDLQMENGSVELKDVELNEKTLNKKLGDNSLFTVKSGVVGSIAIAIPFNDFRKESIKVTLSNIELIIVPGKNETFFEEVVAPISIQSEDDEEDDMPDHGPDPTLNAMERMFEDIFSNIEVTIHNLSIFIETSGGKSSLFSNLSNLSINQAVASSLNGNYTIETHLAYAKFAKDSDGAKTIKFRDISVKLDEKPTDSNIKSTTPPTPTTFSNDAGFDDVGITRRTLSNNVILSYLSSDPSLFDVITYKTGGQPTTPTSSPSKSDSGIFPGGDSSQKIEVAAKLTNSTLKCNLSLENYHRLMFIIGQFLDPANSPTTTSPPTASTIIPNLNTSLGNSTNPLSLSSSVMSNSSYLAPIRSNSNLNTSGFNNNNSNLNTSMMGMSMMGMSNLGMSSLGMSTFGNSNLGSSILQFSAFFPPGANGRTESGFFSNGNLMDSAIFGTPEESRLEKSILTKYSAFSSWTPSLATQKILLRVEIKTGSCNFVIPTENGKTITTQIDFEGLVLKTKKLRVMQNLELRFNKLTVSADDETSVKPVVECGNSIRSSISDFCFKANISLMQSEENNDTTITIEVQSKPIYVLLDNAWLDSIKQLIPADNGSRSSVGGKKGKFSLHVKLHAASSHVVIPFPKKEGQHYFPSRFGKRNWLIDLYLENLKLTHGAIGNLGNGKTHIVADSILSFFGMKHDNDAVKWLDVPRPSRIVVRTKNPAPNPAHAHTHAHAHAHASTHASTHASSSHANAQVRFLSPSFVYGGKKIDLKNFDTVSMQKTSAILVEMLISPTTIEMTKDDYDILMELLKVFSSDEESVMTNIDISCPDLKLTLHDRKKQRLKKKKTEISAKTPTEVYYNTYRLHAENIDFLGSLSHFTTKSNLFVLKVAELEGYVSDNNSTNQGEKIIPLIQKVTKRKPKHESVLSLLVPSGRVVSDEFHISIFDKLCIAPNFALLSGFVDWFTAPPPPPLSLSASSLNSSSCSTSSSSSTSSNLNSSNLNNSNLSSKSVFKSIPLIPPPISMTSSQRSTTQSTTSSPTATSSSMSNSSIVATSHTQIIFPNVMLVHTSMNAGASQIVVSVDRLTVNIISTAHTKITVALDGPRVLLSLLRNYPNLESPNMLKYLMENNFKEVLTLVPNRTEAVSTMEISIKLNDHATKSVISIDFENRKFELSTLSDSFHALKTTFPLFISDVMEYLVGDENEQLGNVPIVTHADESNSTVTLPQMAARQGEGLAESLLSRSWWGGSPNVGASPQTSVRNAREILSQGYFVVEHPENEEDRKKFESNLDVLRKTELVLEIEQEVEADEVQEREANYEMDDSILDSWIVMGSENPREESILNPETVIMICGLIFSWKIDIQKEKNSKSNNNNNNNNNTNNSHIVQLFVDIPLIRFETFPDAWAHRKSMSLRVEFNDIRIEDHLLSSVFKNVFSFDLPQSKKDTGNRVPQNVSVASVFVSARKGFSDTVHYSTKFSLAPVYLGINQRTLDLLLDFFNRSSPDSEGLDSDVSDIPPPPVYFDRFQVSPLKLVVDYKPRGLGSDAGMDYSRIVAGGCLWLVALIPLDRASFTLSNVDLTNTTLDKLPEGVAATWMPNVLATNIPQYLKGVQPIKIVAKMGSGVIGLVRVPIQEYRRDNNILLGVGKGIQTLTFEVLNFGSRVTVSANKILKRTERIISGSPGRQPNEQKISSYANQPSDIREGAVQGMQVLLAALSGAADGIITRPLDEYQRNGKWGFVSTLLRGLPGCVLQPVIGVTGAVSKLTLGLRNTLDSKEKLKADAKYKSNNNNNSENNFTFEIHETSDSAILQNEDEYFLNRSRIQAFQVMEDYGGDENNNNNNPYIIVNNNNNSNNNSNNNNNRNRNYNNYGKNSDTSGRF